LRELVAKIDAPKELAVIKGAGHFFDDQLDELKRVIKEWTVSEARP
jgi:alpha/beta superfamily hydrolase